MNAGGTSRKIVLAAALAAVAAGVVALWPRKDDASNSWSVTCATPRLGQARTPPPGASVPAATAPAASRPDGATPWQARPQAQAEPGRDVEFAARADAVWPVPVDGDDHQINIALEVVNRGTTPLTLNLLDTLRPRLRPPAGEPLKLEASRSRTVAPPPLVLQPGESRTLSRPARLMWISKTKTLRLFGTDPSELTWFFDGLLPGKYLLSFEYQNDRRTATQPFWTGKAITNEIAVEIPGRRH